MFVGIYSVPHAAKVAAHTFFAEKLLRELISLRWHARNGLIPVAPYLCFILLPQTSVVYVDSTFIIIGLNAVLEILVI